MLPRGQLSRATLRTSGVLALRLVAQAGTLVVLANLLGAADFGAYAGIGALAVILGALSTLGSHVSLVRDMARDPTCRDRVLPAALGTTLLAGAVLLCAYLVAATSVVKSTGVAPWVAVLIGVAEIVVQPLILLVSAEHQAREHIARSQLLGTLPLVLRLGVALTIWLLGPAHPLEVFTCGYLAASLVSLGFGLISLPAGWPPIPRWRLLSGRAAWRDNAGFALLGLSGKGPAELDKVLAVRLLPLSLAGAYAAASRVIGATVLPVIALMLSALPRLFRADGGAMDAPRLRFAIFAASLGYGAAASVAVWSLAPAIPWLLGHPFAPAEPLLRLLALGLPGLCLRIAAANILMTTSTPWARLAVEASGMILLVALALVLVPHHPETGLPMAYVATEWAMAVVAWAGVIRSTRPARK